MAQERNSEYIRMLEERNRLKKKISTNSEEERLREMERGFSTNWAGANADKRASEGKRRSGKNRGSGSSSGGGERKKWSKGPPAFILGSQGPVGLRMEGQGAPRDREREPRYRTGSQESVEEDMLPDDLSVHTPEEVDDQSPEIDEDDDPAYDDDDFEAYESNEEIDPDEIMEIDDEDLGASMIEMMQHSNAQDLSALRQSLAESVSTFASTNPAASDKPRKKWGQPGGGLPAGPAGASSNKKKSKGFWGIGSANRYGESNRTQEDGGQTHEVFMGGMDNSGGGEGRRKWGKPQESQQVKLAAVRGSIKDFPPEANGPFKQKEAQEEMDSISAPKLQPQAPPSTEMEPLSNTLLQAVKGLKPSQQAFLLKMLEEMEGNPRASLTNEGRGIHSSESVGDPKMWEEMRKGLARAGADVSRSTKKETTPQKAQGIAAQRESRGDLADQLIQSELQERQRMKTPVIPQDKQGIPTKALILRINSSWAGSRTIGLRALQIFDDGENKVQLNIDQLSLRSGLNYLPSTSALARDLIKLVDGVLESTEEEHMWTGRLMEGAQCLELHIRLETTLIDKGCMLKLYNYDTGNDSMNGVGVKDVDLYLDKLYLWSGVVSRGSKKGPLVLNIKGNKAKEQVRTRSVVFEGMPDYNQPRLSTEDSKSAVDSKDSGQGGDLSWLTRGSSGSRIDSSSSRLGTGRPHFSRGQSGDSLGLEDLGSLPAELKPSTIRRSVQFSAEEMREDYKPPSRAKGSGGRRSRASSRSRSSSQVGESSEDSSPSQTSSHFNRVGKLGSTGPLSIKEDTPSPPQQPEKRGLIVVAPATASLQEEEDMLSPLQREMDMRRSSKSPDTFKRSYQPQFQAPAPVEEEEYKPYSSLKRQNAKDNQLLESWDLLSTFGRRNRGRLGNTGAAILGSGSAKNMLTGTNNNTLGDVSTAAGGGSSSNLTNPSHPRAHRLTDSLKGERERRQQRVQQVMDQVQKIASELRVDDQPGLGRAGLDTIASESNLENSSYASPKNVSPPKSPPIPALPISHIEKTVAEDPEDYLETPHPKTGVVEGSIPYVNEQGLMTNLIVSKNNPGRVVEPKDGSQAPTPTKGQSRYTSYLDDDKMEEQIPGQDPLSLTDVLNMPTTPEGIDPDIDPSSGALDGNMVEIPVLPKGKVLQFSILSTWGDPFYVGLAGMELFDERGNLLKISKDQVVAKPADINVLEGYGNDPRTIDKIFDNHPHTCDDLHVWLAPFDKGEDHTITITFNAQITLSIIRIWNYNKNRAHSYRGVRLLEVTLDNTVIFKGEVRKAPGMLSGPDSCSEVILFTLDNEILEQLQEQDKQSGFDREDNTTSLAMQLKQEMEARRPATGNKEDYLRRASEAPKTEETYEDVMRDLGTPADVRPKTSAARPQESLASSLRKTSQTSPLMAISEKESANLEEPNIADVMVTDSDLVRVKVITVRMLETWGDRNFFGLTGINVLVGSPPIPLPLEIGSVTSYPHGLSDIGYDDDTRTLDKILTNQNQTAEEGEMWLAPFTVGGDHHVRFDLGHSEAVYGLEIWNYNKSEEDALRGVKRVAVDLDGREVGQFLLRPAPGNGLFDFRQTVHLHRRPPQFSVPDILDSRENKRGNYVSPRVRQDYETQMLPSGLLIKVMIHNNWGDHYYVGLDGIQLYDHSGKEIIVTPKQVHAIPGSLKELGQNDVRVASNLFDGTYGSEDGYHSWLAPLANTYHATNPDIAQFADNVVYIMFDHPVCLSMVKLWNYRKTSARGAREISLWIDGNLLYRGSLKKAPPINEQYRGHPILFTNDPVVIRKEQQEIPYCGRDEQDLLCINERQVLIRSKKMFTNPDPCAEGVTPDLSKRPETSLIHR